MIAGLSVYPFYQLTGDNCSRYIDIACASCRFLPTALYCQMESVKLSCDFHENGFIYNNREYV